MKRIKGLLLLLILPAVFAAPTVYARSPERSPGKEYQIDRSAIRSSEWREAINLVHKNYPSLQKGKGLLTLLRVILENPVLEDSVQLFSAAKLVTPEARNSGGIYHEVVNGGFVLVEHLESARRKENKDPVNIGAFVHARPELWVDVPRPGELALLGDVMLRRPPKQKMGRLAVTVTAPAAIAQGLKHLLISPLAVGGGYGKRLRFDTNRHCDTGEITSGSYQIVLPDFDYLESRRTVNVSAGKVTHLEFSVRLQEHIELTQESQHPVEEWRGVTAVPLPPPFKKPENPASRIFKCTAKNGRISYTDDLCPPETKSKLIQ
ncbi:MAG: hypothetical protein GY862_04970 [Gammaproteobacteria bacterium]|nr:hypothetical protein [Gammaproteobacteria bacterium]